MRALQKIALATLEARDPAAPRNWRSPIVSYAGALARETDKNCERTQEVCFESTRGFGRYDSQQDFLAISSASALRPGSARHFFTSMLRFSAEFA
jgi:hypothetical protein